MFVDVVVSLRFCVFICLLGTLFVSRLYSCYYVISIMANKRDLTVMDYIKGEINLVDRKCMRVAHLDDQEDVLGGVGDGEDSRAGQGGDSC